MLQTEGFLRTDKTHPTDLDVTTIPAQLAIRMLNIESLNFTGLIIVDVGAGASPLRAQLARNGAHAFAVDVCYDFPHENSGRTLQRFVYRFLDDICEWIDEGLYVRFEQGADDFLEDYKRHPEGYIRGKFDALPFPNDFADTVVSVNAVGDIKNAPLLEETFRELLRITKPGGTIIIFPLHPNMIPVFDHIGNLLVQKGNVVSFFQDEQENNAHALIRMHVVKAS